MHGRRVDFLRRGIAIDRSHDDAQREAVPIPALTHQHERLQSGRREILIGPESHMCAAEGQHVASQRFAKCFNGCARDPHCGHNDFEPIRVRLRVAVRRYGRVCRIRFWRRPDFDEQETAKLFGQMLDDRAEQFERLTRPMLAGRNNHVGRFAMQKLFGAGIVGRGSVNAQQRNAPIDVQTSAARQLFAHRLVGREGGNDFSRQC